MHALSAVIMNHPAAPMERQLALSANQAVSVPATRGTAVHCLRGTLWLTQEGRWADTILIPGAYFVSDGNGKLVLNAPDGDAVARIVAPASGSVTGFPGAGLHYDHEVFERVASEARRARMKEIGRLVSGLAHIALSVWRSLARRLAKPDPKIDTITVKRKT